MEQGCARLTVCFEDPFWVGIYEREDGGMLEACKITFGAEPKDYEVYAFLLACWRELEFSPGVPAGERKAAALRPKRAQRAAERTLRRSGAGTKAQQALQLQREQNKRSRRERRRERDEAEAERKFQLRQEKRREKHKGH